MDVSVFAKMAVISEKYQEGQELADLFMARDNMGMNDFFEIVEGARSCMTEDVPVYMPDLHVFLEDFARALKEYFGVEQW